MGLDAYVRCNCHQQGRATAHPFPELLRFDENGEPILDETQSPTSEQWTAHDRWVTGSCQHQGVLMKARIGNIAFVSKVRADIEGVESTSSDRFPIVLRKVLYNGTHCRDSIPAVESAEIGRELEALRRHKCNAYTSEFVDTVAALCQASVDSGNPIVF